MKNILLKLAHFILKKYDVIPIKATDKVLYNGMTFEVQSCTLEHNRYKSKLELTLYEV